jgi:putative ABC transport system permease protein
MFLRILGDALWRRKRRKLIVLAAITLGTAAASSLADIALDIGDQMSRELKSFGANLVVMPRGGSEPLLVGGENVQVLAAPSYLEASDVARVKDNFWKNNILDFAPILDVPADVPTAGGTRRVLLRGAWLSHPVPLAANDAVIDVARTGLRRLHPFWSIDGAWPDEEAARAGGGADAAPQEAAAQVLAGAALAARLGLHPGSTLTLHAAVSVGALPGADSSADAPLTVSGILRAGGEEDEMLIAPLETAQRVARLEGKVSRVLVSALTTPESAVYERLATNPRALSPAEFEKWSCTPFVSSIAYELEQAWPGVEVRVVRRVADAEGAILKRSSGLMALVALMAAFAASLTVTGALTTGVLERREEIGLLKSLGASGVLVGGLFLAEALVIGLLGGALGAGLGALLARGLALSVFGTPVAIRPVAIPLAIACALAITLFGCALPVRRIAGLRPAEVLRGR